MLTDALVEQILTRLPNISVGVLGDLFLDRYLDIDASLTEPSLETGLDAYQVVRVRSQPGAAGTVINNLAALGVGRIVPVSIIGDDGEGYEMRQALSAMPIVDQTYLRSWPERRTPTYTKPMLETPGQPARELNRLDIKNRSHTPPDAEQFILDALEHAWNQVDAWIVLDQVSEPECGVVTQWVARHITKLAESSDQFVLADSRERIAQFCSVCIKPNDREAADIAAIRGTSGRTVFLTRGEAGIRLYSPGEAPPVDVPGFPVAGPTDPVGAGDSVSAGIASAVAAGATFAEAAAFGNLVASITVQQLGTTGTATPDQVRARWAEVRSS